MESNIFGMATRLAAVTQLGRGRRFLSSPAERLDALIDRRASVWRPVKLKVTKRN